MSLVLHFRVAVKRHKQNNSTSTGTISNSGHTDDIALVSERADRSAKYCTPRSSPVIVRDKWSMWCGTAAEFAASTESKSSMR
jgi:hypothetical protein